MKLWALLILATMMLGGMLLSGVVLAEDIRGGPKADNLPGTNGRDYIKGNGGADHIDGKKGGDTISGGKGSDHMRGGRGNDWVGGGPDSDIAWGNQGDDQLKADIEERHQGPIRAAKVKGGRKHNKLLGGSGNDIFKARNGKRDIIRGGPGHDTAYVDRRGVDDVEGVEIVVPPQSTHNHAPVANDDSYPLSIENCNGPRAVPLTVDAASGVLGNDTDADGDPLKAVEVSPPTNGSALTLNADGSFTYESADGICLAPASFTYKANDGTADSNVATVTMTPPTRVP